MASGYKVKSLTLKVETGDTSGRSFLATWNFSKSHVDVYKVRFWYKAQTTKNGKKEYNWIGPTESDEKYKQATYSAPENAIAVKVQVKPVSTKHKVKQGKKKVEKSYWTGAWSNVVTKSIVVYGVEKPSSAPTIEIDNKNNITVGYKNLDSTIDKVQFQFVKDGKTTINSYTKTVTITKDNYNSVIKKYNIDLDETQKRAVLQGRYYAHEEVTIKMIVSVKKQEASFIYVGADDSEYKVRGRVCNVVNNVDYWSEWSDYSDAIQTRPSKPKINSHTVVSSTSARLLFTFSNNTEKIILAKADNFDDLNRDDGESYSTVTIDGESYGSKGYLYYTLTDIFGEVAIKIRVVNKNGVMSEWSYFYDFVVGTKPSAPTTWSSNITASLGDSVNLYWTHNSEDGSLQRRAKIELTVDGKSFDKIIQSAHDDGMYYERNVNPNRHFLRDVSNYLSVYFMDKPSSVSTDMDDYDSSTEITLTDNEIFVLKAIFADHNQYLIFKPSITGRLNKLTWSSEYSSSIASQEKGYEDFTNSLVTSSFVRINDVDTQCWLVSETEEKISVYRETENTKDEYGEWSDETSVYVLNTGYYEDSDEILWRIQTMGVIEEYGDWSIQRSIKVYDKPSLIVNLLDGEDGNVIDFDSGEAITQFPVYVNCTTTPATQIPIGYNISIISTETYIANDGLNETVVNDGDAIYQAFYDVNGSPFDFTISSIDADFENGITYKIIGDTAFDSGLTAEYSNEFTVNLEDEVWDVSGEATYDEDDHVAYITAMCTEEDTDILAENVTISIYRRTSNGKFVLVQSDIPNDGLTSVTDPHPTLDYMRYRVVATSRITGSIVAYDLEPVETGETSIIIQWEETWTEYDETDLDDESSVYQQVGKVLLPYNISTTENNSMDTNLVEYIGRERPVSYYGTQLGESHSWTCEIPRSDSDTLYRLRRLMVYPGDVYVRDPSGNGFWAQVKTSFNRKYNSLVIPVTLTIVPVEGGM